MGLLMGLLTSKRSGSQERRSSGTSGELGESRLMPPALKTWTAVRRPESKRSWRKFMSVVDWWRLCWDKGLAGWTARRPLDEVILYGL